MGTTDPRKKRVPRLPVRCFLRRLGTRAGIRAHPTGQEFPVVRGESDSISEQPLQLSSWEVFDPLSHSRIAVEWWQLANLAQIEIDLRRFEQRLSAH